MDFTRQRPHGPDEQTYHHHDGQYDQTGSQSWTDSSFFFPNSGSSLLGSPIGNQVYLSTAAHGSTWQNNPNDLSQDIHQFLDTRTINHEPWTGHPRPPMPEQLWNHSLPGPMASMSDPGQDFGQRHDFDGGSIVSPTDSIQYSFNDATSVRYDENAPWENDQFSWSRANPMQVQNYLARPQQAESVVSDPMGQYPRTQPRINVRNSRNKTPVRPCPLCGKSLKNPSDEQKHLATHTKPHECDVEHCSRSTEGFATRNDLERHRKAVHGLEPLVGRKSGYICIACAQIPSSTPQKFWPRRDNFKAHIGRKHAEWNANELLDRSEIKMKEPKPDSAYVSAPSQVDPFDNMPHQELTSPSDIIGFVGQTSQQGDYHSFDFKSESNDDALAGVGAGTSADPSLGNRASDTGFHVAGWNGRHGLSVLSDAAATVKRVAAPSNSALSRSADDSGMWDLPIDQPEPGPESSQVGGWIDPSLDSSMQGSMSTERAESQSKHPDGDFLCEACNKRKKRECDLRKHMKRHTRPYGCTFPSCWKKFGSRNDWKRHENSQHFLQEMYRCELLGPNGKVCNKPYNQRESFIAHLQDLVHAIPSSEVDQRAEEMRLGRHGHNRFWCGFCNEQIPTPPEVQSAWDFRFQHIGDHFDKDHRDIKTWICAEENKCKGDLEKLENKSGLRKQTQVGGGPEEDSDLGDDGIPEPLYLLSTSGKGTQGSSIDADEMSDYDVPVVGYKMDWKQG